jgi:cytochrome c biogenesis factor
VVFTVFAFIVLLGTVFPLIVEALQDRRPSSARPYFDRLSIPIGITLLFLMAVAPCCRGARRRRSCCANGSSGPRGAVPGRSRSR